MHSKTKQIVFIEGLPGVGKSTLLEALAHDDVEYVEEVIVDVSNLEDGTIEAQQQYMTNDDLKITRALLSDKQRVIIDRGPVSTAAYSLVKHSLDKGYDTMDMLSWFEEAKKIYGSKDVDVKVIYLKGKSKIPYVNDKDPYGSTGRLEVLESVTVTLLKLFCPSFSVRKYDYTKDKITLDEIFS